jgi:opacity protein-like surface antigen
MKLVGRSAVIVCLIGIFSAALFAQKVELYPNAGAFFPERVDGNKFKSDGIYGLKGGVFVGQNAQLEGSFSYLNHFELKNAPNSFNAAFGVVQPTVFGMLVDLNGSYNFGQRQFLNSRVSPFVTAGVGTLTAVVRHGNSTFIEGGGNVIAGNGAIVPNPGRSVVLNDGDTFFTFNYGVGVKALNLWGPVGLRADVRGRTLPNFFGKTNTWAETTGGLVFSWGER